MAQAKGGGCKTSFKFGCLGCLAFVLFLIAITAVVFGIAWNQVRNEVVEEQDLIQLQSRANQPGLIHQQVGLSSPPATAPRRSGRDRRADRGSNRGGQ